MSQQKSHVRVRTLRDGINDGAMSVYCTECNADAVIGTPIKADDFCAMLEAFLDNHEDCKEDR